MKLIIGNQNYSSWSLRPWILLTQFNITFEQSKILLFADNSAQELSLKTPNKKVPVLEDEALIIWDSLAICEYINDRYLSGKGWPTSTRQRAQARAICAEMHAGFMALRNEMPMNCRRSPAKIELSNECQLDIERIISLWKTCLAESNGPFLFNEFSIADAFYLPVVSRLISYEIEVPSEIKTYMNTMMNLPGYQKWLLEAKQELAVIDIAEK